MAAKHKPKELNGRKWRCYYIPTGVDIVVAKARLAACPLPALKEKVSFNAEGGLRYAEGLLGQEIECAKWILQSKVPDERKLSPEWAEQIFEWVRETA